MAQTDARPGFRLPWSSDRQPTDGDPATEQEAAAWPSEDGAKAAPSQAVAAEGAATDAPTAEGAQTDPTTGEAQADARTGSAASSGETPLASTPEPQKPAKRPTKFMADLTKAMQAAAEDARARALTQLQADAKTHVETIHGRSSTDAAGLRRNADDDVAAVREWSKAEIARIREETEAKITERKARLETEIEQHAGVIEHEIDAVQKMVAAFEDEMAAFFERLLGEEDPSRFATMAENLPEPPMFDDLVGDADPIEAPEGVVETLEVEAVVAEPDLDADFEAEAAVAEPEVVAETAVAETEIGADDVAATNGTVETADGGDGEIDRESAFAAIQAAAEAAASAEVAASAAARAEAVADVAIEIMGNHDEEAPAAEADPRFAALGLSPDFDAAEAEALAAAGDSDEEIPEIADDALAARLAGLVPGKGKGDATSAAAATQIVVVGLVSVASIASFKRHLGRIAGVQSVGVSSGPDGEFIFAVTHGTDVVMRDAIPGLPSFQARVTGSSDGVVHVTAHDPEADA